MNGNSDIGFDEILGGTMEWQNKESFTDFTRLTNPFLSTNSAIEASDVDNIKQTLQGRDITEEEIDAFIVRWNATATARNLSIYSPNAQYPNIIDNDWNDACF